jgi:small subunit ribosomal protein S20
LANHKSAEKRARQAVRRNARNTQTISAVRTFEKKVTTAVASGDAAGAKAALNDYMSKATKAATKGTIHKKAAARKIGRLAARVSKLAAK